MSKSTYTGNSESAYMVEGRKFYDFAIARAFAEQHAQQAGRLVRIMEKTPDLPWHVVAEIEA